MFLVLRNSALAIFAAATFAVSGSANIAADSTRPRLWCWWDGTAPFCDGSCGSAQILGAYQNADEARERDKAIPSVARDSNAWRTFGKPCVTGTKAYCCLEQCPNGYRLLEETLERSATCEKIETKTRDLELPGPEGIAKTRKKGPIVEPGPVEETELNKGPIMKPGPVEGTNVETGPILAKPGESEGNQAKQTDVLTPEESKGPSPFGEAKPYATKRKTGPLTQD